MDHELSEKSWWEKNNGKKYIEFTTHPPSHIHDVRLPCICLDICYIYDCQGKSCVLPQIKIWTKGNASLSTLFHFTTIWNWRQFPFAMRWENYCNIFQNSHFQNIRYGLLFTESALRPTQSAIYNVCLSYVCLNIHYTCLCLNK